MFPILLTSSLCVNHTLSLKAQDMQKNYRTCSEASHYLAMMRPTCLAANKVVFFAKILDSKEHNLTWEQNYVSLDYIKRCIREDIHLFVSTQLH
jgi:poly(3-hydroxyalkanoate) synthetase